MIVSNIVTSKGTTVKLTVEDENNRITNTKYQFFLKSVFLGKNDKIEDYLEVDYSICGRYVNGEIPKTEAEQLGDKVKTLNETLSEFEAEQQEMVNIVLCAIDEMYQLIENITPKGGDE